MRVRTVGANVLVWHPHWCYTALPDGVVVYAQPHRTEMYLGRAIQHGYGWAEDPEVELCREHEALHVLLCAELGLPESPTLRDVANELAMEYVGRERVPDYQWLEEGRVLDLALYLNTGDEARHIHNELPALSWEFDLPDFRRRALDFLRSPDHFFAWEELLPAQAA